MKILHEIYFNNTRAVRLFSSTATARKNNVRIHYHSMIEISLILSGKGKYKSNKTSYTINSGDMFFYRPNEAHCITDIEEEGMELLNLHVAPYYLYTQFPNALNSDYIKILSAAFPLKGNKLNDFLTSADVELLHDIMLGIKSEYEKKDSDYETVCNNYISSILILLSRAHANGCISKNEKLNYKKIVSSIAYVNERYKTDISLDQIANMAGYSRCYFSTVFKKCMGMSVWDYVCIKRIEDALFLIKTSDKSVLQIALECGFNNTANFNKIFKKYTNLSPSAFRK